MTQPLLAIWESGTFPPATARRRRRTKRVAPESGERKTKRKDRHQEDPGQLHEGIDAAQVGAAIDVDEAVARAHDFLPRGGTR